MERDKKYWEDAIELLSDSAKSCRSQHKNDYERAILFAKKKLRRLRLAALLLAFCLVIGVGGCNTIKAIGGVTQALGEDIQIVAEGTQERMRQ